MTQTSEIETDLLHPSYTTHRSDILQLIPSRVKTVLDIGCSNGSLGETIRRNKQVEVTGIENNEAMASDASLKLNRVIFNDIETLSFANEFQGSTFDCIIFADILEHLKDPWAILTRCRLLLSEKGVVIASIPNIRHYTSLIELAVKGNWPYRDRGIHDKTHLRFFTLKTIRQMFESAGLEIKHLRRNYRLIERQHSLNQYAHWLRIPVLREFFAYQYLIVAQNAKRSS